MATENVRKVLDVYAHFKAQAGESLTSSYFLGLGELRRWTAKDLKSGLEEARREGLIEGADHGWRLTEAGFREATKQQ